MIDRVAEFRRRAWLLTRDAVLGQEPTVRSELLAGKFWLRFALDPEYDDWIVAYVGGAPLWRAHVSRFG